jgi:hypothetical protein
MILIDPPTPFDTLAEWKAFLAEMKSLEPSEADKPEVLAAIAEAEETIAEKEAGGE